MSSKIIEAVSEIIGGSVTPLGEKSEANIFALDKKSWRKIDPNRNWAYCVSLVSPIESETGGIVLDMYMEESRMPRDRTIRSALREVGVAHEVVEAGLVALSPRGQLVVDTVRRVVLSKQENDIARRVIQPHDRSQHLEGVVAELSAMKYLVNGNTDHMRTLIGYYRGLGVTYERTLRLELVDSV